MRQSSNVLTITNPKIVNKIKELALSNETCPSTYAEEALEYYLNEHRSQRPYVGDPDRFSEQNDVDEYELHPDLYAEVEKWHSYA